MNMGSKADEVHRLLSEDDSPEDNIPGQKRRSSRIWYKKYYSFIPMLALIMSLATNIIFVIRVSSQNECGHSHIQSASKVLDASLYGNTANWL